MVRDVGFRPVSDHQLVADVLNAWATGADVYGPDADVDHFRASLARERAGEPTSDAKPKVRQPMSPEARAKWEAAHREAHKRRKWGMIKRYGLRVPEEVEDYQNIRAKGYSPREAADIILRSRRSGKP
jgi:hypothetical protein